MAFGGFRWRRKLGRPGVAPPAPVAISMGARTLLGYGGVAVSEAANSAISGGSFKVDSSSFFVPANSGGGTLGGIWTAPSSGNVTGASSQVYATTIVANAGHVRGETEFDAYLIKTTANSGPIKGGSVLVRDGAINPTAALDYVDCASLASITGTGRVTIASANPDTSMDSNGNYKRGGGATVGMIYWEGDSSDSAYPFDFVDYSFYTNTATPATGVFFQYQNGSGIGFLRCLIENGTSVTTAPSRGGLTLRGNAVVQDCHFKNLGNAANLLAPTHALAGTVLIENNVFEGAYSDIMEFSGAGVTVTHNLAFDMQFSSGEHQDFLQLTGNFGVSYLCPPPTKNIYVCDIGGNTNAFLYYNDITGPGYISWTGVIANNICAMGNIYGIELQRPDNPRAQYNTILRDALHSGTMVSTGIVIRPGQEGINGATLTHNVTNALTASSQPGTVVTTPNKLFSTSGKTGAQLLADYQVAFPNYPSTQASALWKTYAGNLIIFTPANTLTTSGGVMNADGTCCGALFPAPAGYVNGPWNDGSVYDPLNGTWLAAHPAAT